MPECNNVQLLHAVYSLTPEVLFVDSNNDLLVRVHFLEQASLRSVILVHQINQ